MIYSLEPKQDALKYILGNVDQLDVSYTLQSDSNTSFNSILLCMNPSMLNILYKYDSFSSQFEDDQTDSGNMECLEYKLEVISDNIVKIFIKQKFVRCFSFYKESTTIKNENCGVTSNEMNYVSLYPSLFLDFENSDLNNILTPEERIILLSSKALNIEFNSSGGFQLPLKNKTASKGITYPKNIELFSFIDNNLNYSTNVYSLIDSVTNEEYNIDLWYDDNPGEDKYSSQAKTFNIINDSTVILNFIFYINLNKFKYLLDINDININYHINVSGDNEIGTGTFTLDLYESHNGYFKVNDVIYIKDIYADTISCVCKILNVVGNKLTLSRLQSSNPSIFSIIHMDKYILNKIKNLENFNNIQNRNNFLKDLMINNLFVIKDIEFTIEDYLSINNLG